MTATGPDRAQYEVLVDNAFGNEGGAVVLRLDERLEAHGLSLDDFDGSLQDAVDALPAEGGTIVVPVGTWTQSGAVTISKSDVTIIGSTMRGCHLRFTGSHGLRFLASGDNVRRCHVENVWVSGDSTSSTYGLHIEGSGSYGSTDHTFTNVRVTGFASVVRMEKAWAIRFTGCTLDDATGPTIWVVSDTNNISFVSCRIGTSGTWVFQVDVGHSINLVGCDIEGGTFGGAWFRSGSGGLIHGCYFESNGNGGVPIRIGDTSGATSYHAVTALGNFVNGYDAAGNALYCIEVQRGDGCVVMGNACSNTTSYGITSSASVNDITLLTNYFNGIGSSNVAAFGTKKVQYDYPATRTVAMVNPIPAGGNQSGSVGNSSNVWADAAFGKVTFYPAAGANPNTQGRSSPQNYGIVIFGYGDPNGAVTAPWGSLFVNLDGGASGSLYTNQSATGVGTTWVLGLGAASAAAAPVDPLWVRSFGT